MPSSSDIVDRLSYARAHASAYVAVEFDLALGERTGRQMVFDAGSMSEAARKLAYTLNLSSSGWRVSRSGRTVSKMEGDIGWNLVKAESPVAKNLGEEHREEVAKQEREQLEEVLGAEEAEPLEGEAHEEDELEDEDEGEGEDESDEEEDDEDEEEERT